MTTAQWSIAMQAQLQIRVNRKAFNDRVILDDVRLELRAGEIVALIGPSGCGKSTLLRIAAGLERDYFGEVRLEDVPVLEPVSTIGIMFQEPRLLPWLNVADNVTFNTPHSKQGRERAHALLDEVGLRDFADALPKQLSGGMTQRVALARALFREPAVLLLDEPFSAVDALTRIILQDLLLEVARRRRTTVLLVTHDVEEALFLADRVVVMRRMPGTPFPEIVNLRAPRQRADALLAPLRHAVLDRLRGTEMVENASGPYGLGSSDATQLLRETGTV
jgi:sulfonate transport system ATP-binding protein